MSSRSNNRQRHRQLVALLFCAVLAHRTGATHAVALVPFEGLHLQPAVYIQTGTAASPAGYILKVADVTAPQPVDKKLGPPPALYTKEQAQKGLLGYLQNCASCHGPALDGQPGGFSGPALKGEDFADPSYDFHVSDIFNFVAKLMPSATPGSLPPDVYVAIMAFILQQNGYPAGSRELTYDEAMKSSVPIRYYGK
jgi:polar amino acid transport system substrate-binding protein